MITVIKLGGSLLSAGVLPACLDAVDRYAGQILLVPGGGLFADLVRDSQMQWRFDDLTAHRMAILAMRQMALLCMDIKPGLVLMDDPAELNRMPRIALWAPDFKTLEDTGIAASWGITSDSLAAWLAGQVKADALLLVKSCTIADNAELADLQRLGIVDAGFPDFVQQAGFKTTVVNQAQFLAMP